jgi:Ca2+-dependent lipid-binding protein
MSDILNLDVLTGSDAFVDIRCGMDSFHTKTVMDSQEPKWNEEFHFRSFGSPYVHASLFDKDKYDKDDPLGMVEINLDKITAGEPINEWYTLKPMQGCMNPSGELHLVVTWEVLDSEVGLVKRKPAKATKTVVSPAKPHHVFSQVTQVTQVGVEGSEEVSGTELVMDP